MNMITGAILIGAAAVLYLKHHPPIRSTTAKIYGAACGFGVFSVAFPLSLHWSLIMIGMILQLVALACCIVAAHDYRASAAIQQRRRECREMGNEMQADYEIDRTMCNAFFNKGVQAATIKKVR